MTVLAAAVILLVILALGQSLLVIGRLRLPAGWSAAYATGIGALGLLTAVFAVTGIPWRLPHVLGGMLVLLLLASLLRLRSPSRLHPREGLGLITVPAVIIGALWAILPALLVPAFHHEPIQGWDTTFHMSGTQLVRESGEIAPWEALAPLYGVAGTYYPTLWHGITALGPGEVDLVSNAMVLVMLAAWPLSIPILVAGLLRRVASRSIRTRIAVLATVLGGSTVSLLYLAVYASRWPYSLSVTLIPAALGVLSLALAPGIGPRARVGRFAVVALIGVGMMAAQPSGGVLFVLLGVAVALVAIDRDRLLRWVRCHRRAAVGLVVGLGTMGAAAAVVMLPRLRSMAGYDQPPGNPVISAAVAIFDRSNSTAVDSGPFVNTLVVLAAVLGVLLWRRRAGSAIAAGAMAVLLVMIAGGPEWVGRAIAAPWYNDRARLIPAVALIVIVLAAGGIEALGVTTAFRMRHRDRGRWIRTSVAAIAVLAVAGTTVGGRLPERRDIIASTYVPGRSEFNKLLQPGERQFIEESSELIGEGTVLGDPFDGTTYYWSLAEVPVVYPQLGWMTGGPQANLAGRIPLVGVDPSVCYGLKSLDVAYYYRDDDPSGARLLDESEGGQQYATVGLFPEKFLTPVASSGPRTLYAVDLPC